MTTPTTTVSPAPSDLLLAPPARTPADAGDDAGSSPVALAARGVPGLPVPDADVYPGLLDTAKMREVYRNWMCRSENCGTVQAAAEKAGVCPETALYWAERGDWIAQKRRLLKVMAQEQAVALESRRVAIRTEESMRQIGLGQKLRERAEEMLERGTVTVFNKKTGEDMVLGMSPEDLQYLASVAKSGGDLVGRFMGVAEPKAGGELAAAGEAPADEKPKTQLFVVVQGGGLPPVRPAGGKVIEVNA